MLLQDFVTRQAERRPDAIAVVHDDVRLTYAALAAQSDQLARALRDAGCRRGDRVCWLGPKSPAALIAILGIYKADGIYVPLDKASPVLRLKRVIEACQPCAILAGGVAGERLADFARLGALDKGIRLGWTAGPPPATDEYAVDFTLEDIKAYPARPLTSASRAGDPAHIFFTSGSTGVPKGVVITHANVLRFTEWAVRYFGIGQNDRASGHSPLHFDLSIFDIFSTLAAGAELHLVPNGLGILPKQLTEFIRSHALTQWFSVPSILIYLAKFDAVSQNDFPDLKRLMWCGEVFPTQSLIYWMRRLPHVTFTNLYGPTEATIASSYYTLTACPDDPRRQIPIGSACDGEELVVLRRDGTRAGPDESGELHIAGEGLSPGYWCEPDKTQEVFVRDPRDGREGRLYRTGDLAREGRDGLFYFIGRSDTQIKSRGHRIELGEIESALNALDTIQESAVVSVPTDGFEGTLIGCAYVPMPSGQVNPHALRVALSQILQGYMIPSLWMSLEHLPRNANNKIDRPKLKEEFLRRAATTT